MGKPTSAAPWSYSKVKSFETCPFQFYYMKVLRLYRDEETEAMRYGTMFHESAEYYVRDGTELPEAFEFARDTLDMFKSMSGEKLCEVEMGLNADLDACDMRDDAVWWRGICDLTIVDGVNAKVVDYKTGRNARYADKGQLELMALATFAHFPEVQTIRAGLLFVVANEFITDKYTRKDMPDLWAKWLGKFNRMQKAYDTDVWNACPSGLCRKHCKVLECPHNGRR